MELYWVRDPVVEGGTVVVPPHSRDGPGNKSDPSQMKKGPSMGCCVTTTDPTQTGP